MSGIEGLGPIYAKLGIATAADLITARKSAAEAGWDAFKLTHLAGAVRGALGLGVDPAAKPLFNAMRVADPTLDLQPSDLEAGALLGAILSEEMKRRSRLGGYTALAITTAGFGATRQSRTHPQLVREADEALASMQLQTSPGPVDLKAPTMPTDVAEALAAVTTQNNQYGGTTLTPAPAKAAIARVADYALAVQAAAVASANAANAQLRRLEEEMRTYWWVVGGWSDERRSAFRALAPNEAAMIAGVELAGKTSLPLGLFAAPALLDRVMRDGRTGRPQRLALAEAVAAVPAGLRERFRPAAELYGDLLPLSLALALSGEAAADEDWRPRFKRRTGVAADNKLGPHDLAVQAYREVVLARALPKSA